MNQYRNSFETNSGKFITVGLFVLSFEEGDNYISYCPAINVYGYGKSEKQARESFDVCLQEYFHYTTNKGTLFEDLKSLGWTQKSKYKLQPPSLSKLIARNKGMADIWNSHNFSKVDTSIRIPC